MRASAYLTIFDDWDLLGPALASIYDRVEEIVVVDGAYRWMAPLFTAAGRDPERSSAEVYAALAPFEPKLRVITGLWDNELHKRSTGFAACRERYVYRIDADEVLFFDDAEIERFLASPQAVAEMEMPIYLAPGLIRGRAGTSKIECQSFLFDRERIEPAEHCAYLWLVLPANERAALPAFRHGVVHQTPIAFNAHLTQWRTPRTALARERFYHLNAIRESRDVAWLGLPPIPAGLDDVAWCAALFDRLSPKRLEEMLLGRAVTVGWTGLGDNGMRTSPLTAEQESSFAPLFARQLEALADHTRGLSDMWRAMPTGQDYLIDISSIAARAALGHGPQTFFAFDEMVESVEARRLWLCPEPPFQRAEPLAVQIKLNLVAVDLPAEPPHRSFRCVLSLIVQLKSGRKAAAFRIEP